MVWCLLSASILFVSASQRTREMYVPGETLSARVASDLWLVLDRLPEQGLVFGELAFVDQLSFSSSVSSHVARQIVFPRENVLASVIRLPISSDAQ